MCKKIKPTVLEGLKAHCTFFYKEGLNSKEFLYGKYIIFIYHLQHKVFKFKKKKLKKNNNTSFVSYYKYSS